MTLWRWRWRSHRTSAHHHPAGVRAGAAGPPALVINGADRALLLAGLVAVLAAFALPDAQARQMAAAVDWFSVLFFTLSLRLHHLGGCGAVVTGWPAQWRPTSPAPAFRLPLMPFWGWALPARWPGGWPGALAHRAPNASAASGRAWSAGRRRACLVAAADDAVDALTTPRQPASAGAVCDAAAADGLVAAYIAMAPADAGGAKFQGGWRLGHRGEAGGMPLCLAAPGRTCRRLGAGGRSAPTDRPPARRRSAQVAPAVALNYHGPRHRAVVSALAHPRRWETSRKREPLPTSLSMSPTRRHGAASRCLTMARAQARAPVSRERLPSTR